MYLIKRAGDNTHAAAAGSWYEYRRACAALPRRLDPKQSSRNRDTLQPAEQHPFVRPRGESLESQANMTDTPRSEQWTFSIHAAPHISRCITAVCSREASPNGTRPRARPENHPANYPGEPATRNVIARRPGSWHHLPGSAHCKLPRASINIVDPSSHPRSLALPRSSDAWRRTRYRRAGCTFVPVAALQP